VSEQRGELNKGLDTALSKAFELALTPAIVGALGWLIDSRLGTTPAFTIVFFFLGVAGTSMSAWYRYDAAMIEQQALAADARAARTPRRRPTFPSPFQLALDEAALDGLRAEELAS